MDYLPVFIDLRNGRAVVVGGGRVAARKVELLCRAGAHVTVVAPDLVDELVQLAATGAIQHVAARFEPGHLHGASVAIGATSIKAVNSEVSAAARARHIPVNVVDDPQLSTFIFPAIIDRSPVIVAVGSSGHSPVLARRLREQLESLLPAQLGALARFMGDRRQEVRDTLPARERRPFWERIIGGIVGSRVLAGDETGARKVFKEELAKPNATGEVYLIGAGPGDPDLLTLRALQLLQQADVVLYDRLVSDAVLERARRDAQRVYVGKEPGDHHVTQERIHELLLHYARKGLRVARLKGGDPFIFGRGGEEIEVLQANGIPYVVVPGITAALGAAAIAGIPLTHRRLAQSVTFTTGHASEDTAVAWDALARPNHTTVFYMGLAQLPHIVAKLVEAGAPWNLPAVIVERATLAEQRLVRGTLESIVETARNAQLAPPALLIVGDVAALARTDLDVGVREAVPVEKILVA